MAIVMITLHNTVGEKGQSRDRKTPFLPRFARFRVLKGDFNT